METQQETYGQFSLAPGLVHQSVGGKNEDGEGVWQPDVLAEQPGTDSADSRANLAASRSGTVAAPSTNSPGKLSLGSGWWLVVGTPLLAATAVIGTTIYEIRLLTPDVIGSEPTGVTPTSQRLTSETPPIWPHSGAATVVMDLMLVLACLILPVAIGLLARSWAWAGIAPAIVFVAALLGTDQGQQIAAQRYRTFYGADMAMVFSDLMVWILMPIFALLLAAMATAMSTKPE
jgi:hypothetical protein